MIKLRRNILILILLVCFGCFNEKNTKNEPQAICGVTFDNRTERSQPQIFKKKCATCHSYHSDMTGPKMSGILDRVPSKEWLRKFITNQDSLIEVEDKYTLEIMEWSAVEWNHNFDDLEKADLDTLLNYILQ